MVHATILALAVVVTLAHVVVCIKPRYQHFEDYLSNLDEEEKTMITKEAKSNDDEDDPDDGSDLSSMTTTTPASTTTPPLWAGFTKTKDVTCCMLGQLAGDKGYHCFAKYYVARLLMRNMNRAHNRKMSFYGRGKIPNYGDRVMKTFEQCVAGYANVFHKCCHIASMEIHPRRYDSAQRERYSRQRQDVSIN